MQSHLYRLECVGCHTVVSEEESVARCPACGEALRVVYDEPAFAARVATHFDRDAPRSGKKYAPFYPLTDLTRAVSLGEGGTPLIRLQKLGAEIGVSNVYVKNEGQNPTGVFKDRGSLVEITKALELKATALAVASTGNMAASVSAYAAVAGLPCYVLIPEGTPLGKLAQSMSYGARVLQIRGTYGDCCVLAEEMAARHGQYLAGDYCFRAEGQKSLAFEVVEELGWRAPDIVIVPVGCGTNIAAIWQGFVEYHRLGFIDKLPRMVAVQPEGCSTVVAGFLQGLPKAPIVTNPKTICSAVGIGTPLDDVKALQALTASGGTAITVSELDATNAQKSLGGVEAIFTEPSGALAYAAVAPLLAAGFIEPTDTVVCVATGNGLKDPLTALAHFPTPPSVEPDVREVDRFLTHKLYAIRAAGFEDKEKHLFAETPTIPLLADVIRREFDADLKENHLEEIREAIAGFLTKGKQVAKADLQHLVENALTDLTYEERVLVVQDYSLRVTKSEPATAEVAVLFRHDRFTAKAKGVGPVDAVIAALRVALAERDALGIRLTNFAVGIDDRGTDATTEVTMELRDAAEHRVIAAATSPDIIAASIAAFEKGYNILYWKNQK